MAENGKISDEMDLRAFYEKHPYPPFDPGLDLHASGRRKTVGHPKDWFHMYFPRQPWREDIDILIAGCGTTQTGTLAVGSRRARITAIDISRAALESTAKIKEQYSLKNVEIRELPVEKVADLGKQFDLIYCTGVLHHLADPLEGLRALRSVLRLDGSMNLMLYARYGRLGLTMMQELLRRAGASADRDGIAKTRQWITTLGPEHPFREAAADVLDVGEDAGLADLLLNPRERSYSVPEVIGFLKEGGMRLQRFMYQSRYKPRCSGLRDTPLLSKIEALATEDQYAVGELFRSSIRKHQFVACRDERSESSTMVKFAGTRWLDYVPVPTPGIRVKENREGNSVVGADLSWPTYESRDIQIHLDEHGYQMYKQVDGARSIRKIINDTAADDARRQRERARSLFEGLWDFDFMMYKTVERAGPVAVPGPRRDTSTPEASTSDASSRDASSPERSKQ